MNREFTRNKSSLGRPGAGLLASGGIIQQDLQAKGCPTQTEARNREALIEAIGQALGRITS
jgi:hypothetical protein